MVYIRTANASTIDNGTANCQNAQSFPRAARKFSSTTSSTSWQRQEHFGQEQATSRSRQCSNLSRTKIIPNRIKWSRTYRNFNNNKYNIKILFKNMLARHFNILHPSSSSIGPQRARHRYCCAL
ncbi:hypothetical protein PM082_006386 [Marasmius tenuissimus]|nr:hypothetical protein PM082_006386 [Marasmius tenuissimus]